MRIRKFAKCIWCDKTIDVTNTDAELCSECATYPNFNEARKHYLEAEQYQRVRSEPRV